MIENVITSHNLMSWLNNSLPTQRCKNINCKYYHTDHFNQTFHKFKPKFSLFHHNIRSLNKHRIELQMLLSSLNVDFQVIALTEIGKINAENHSKFFKDYHFYHDPSTKKCGGVGLLIKRAFKL